MQIEIDTKKPFESNTHPINQGAGDCVQLMGDDEYLAASFVNLLLLELLRPPTFGHDRENMAKQLDRETEQELSSTDVLFKACHRELGLDLGRSCTIERNWFTANFAIYCVSKPRMMAEGLTTATYRTMNIFPVGVDTIPHGLMSCSIACGKRTRMSYVEC